MDFDWWDDAVIEWTSDLAVLCLALSGLCDMFDGKIARTKKDRTEIEKRFGIQIDSCVTLSVLELDRRSSVIVWE